MTQINNNEDDILVIHFDINKTITLLDSTKNKNQSEIVNLIVR